MVAEAYDGTNGFAIGGDHHPDRIEEQDRIDSENLYKVLEEEVISTFYNRDASGVPRQWIGKIRRSHVDHHPEHKDFGEWCKIMRPNIISRVSDRRGMISASRI